MIHKYSIPKVIIYVLLILTAVSVKVYAQDVRVTANIQESFGVLNQAVTVSIVVEGGNATELTLPEFGGWFNYVGTAGTSSSTVIAGGKTTTSSTLNYSLIPIKVGNATIAPFVVTVGGKKYSTETFTFEIKSSNASPPTPGAAGNQPTGQNNPIDLILAAIPEKTVVYQNEGVTIVYKVYIGTGISVTEYTPVNQPNTVGFWMEEYPQSTSPVPKKEMYNGKIYSAALLKKIELFPTSSGELEVDPMQIDFRARINNRRTSIRSFFDDPFFNRTKNVRINSNTIKITVKPFPERGKPSDFDGLVGSYDITASVNTGRVKANESITLKVNYAGEGNIKLLPKPVLNIKGDHEQYEPQVSDKLVKTGSSVKGTKNFEYVIIPRKEGELKIEAIRLVYFDPSLERYIVKRTSPITIKIDKGDRVNVGAARNLTRNEIRLVGTDIRFIKESAEEWIKSGEGIYSGFSFLSLVIFPVFILGGVFAYSKYTDKLNSDIGYKRSRQANSIAAKRLRTAITLLDSGNETDYYPEIANTLQEYIADKLNISAAGLLTDELEKILSKKKLDEDIIKLYISCLSICDFHRFSSVNSGEEEMRNLYNDSQNAIVEIEERFKKVKV